jgi:hypothetical protein
MSEPGASEDEMVNLDKHYPNVIEFVRPLTPGDRIGDDGLKVLAVSAIAATLTLAGEPRPLWVALHEKRRNGSMLTIFVCLDVAQCAWSLEDA